MDIISFWIKATVQKHYSWGISFSNLQLTFDALLLFMMRYACCLVKVLCVIYGWKKIVLRVNEIHTECIQECNQTITSFCTENQQYLISSLQVDVVQNMYRVEPEVVSSFSSVFPIPQVIPVSNFRPLSLLVFILWRFEISNLFDSD